MLRNVVNDSFISSRQRQYQVHVHRLQMIGSAKPISFTIRSLHPRSGLQDVASLALNNRICAHFRLTRRNEQDDDGRLWSQNSSGAVMAIIITSASRCSASHVHHHHRHIIHRAELNSTIRQHVGHLLHIQPRIVPGHRNQSTNKKSV